MAVSDKFIISTINTLEGLTLASTITPETAYPAGNMTNQNSNEPTVIDIGSNPAQVDITWSNATAYPYNYLILSGIDFPDDNTIDLQLYADAGQAGTSQLTGDLAVINIGSNLKEQFVVVFDEFTAKSGRIRIKTPSYNADEILTIDKVHAGLGTVLDYGFEYGTRFWIEETSEHTKKPGGGVETKPGDAIRRFDAVFNGSDDTEMILLQDKLEVAKLGGDFFMSADPNNTRGLRHKRSGIYRRMNNIDFQGQHSNWNDWGLSGHEN